jgi:hypothetical protein
LVPPFTTPGGSSREKVIDLLCRGPAPAGAVRGYARRPHLLNSLAKAVGSFRQHPYAVQALAGGHVERLLARPGKGDVLRLAAGHALPAIFPWREYALAGGLMSYGSSVG